MNLGQLSNVAKVVAPVVAIAIIGAIGETGKDGGFIKDIWAVLKTASPPVAMVMFWLFIRESAKRDFADKQCNERTIDFIKSTNAATSTFDRALNSLVKVRRRTRTKRRRQ